MMSYPILARSTITSSRVVGRSLRAKPALRSIHNVCRTITAQSANGGSGKWGRPLSWALGGSLMTVSVVIGSSQFPAGSTTTSLDAAMTVDAISVPKRDGSSLMDSNSSYTTEKAQSVSTREPETGISFPSVFDSKDLIGCGVRKKFHFVNVYAVGFYVDTQDFDAIQDEEEFEKALLNPHKARTVRIVFNRAVTMKQVIDTLRESLEPRMNGQDLHSLDEFSKLRDAGQLEKGDEVILTIKGPNIECKCSNGASGVVRSEIFTRAVNDVYFGKDPVSPAAKESVLVERKTRLSR